MTAALAPRLGLPGTRTETSYLPPADLTFDEWCSAVGTLQAMERSVKWWDSASIAHLGPTLYQIAGCGKIEASKRPDAASTARGRRLEVTQMRTDPITLSPLSTAAAWWPRFAAKIEVAENGCWLWQAYIDSDGYGRFSVTTSKPDYAHRLAYRALRGPIGGETLDHLCHTNDATCPGGRCVHRRCVNPWHCEPVTSVVNVMRGTGLFAREARATECAHGHAFTPENVYAWRGHRYCRACRKARRAS